MHQHRRLNTMNTLTRIARLLPMTGAISIGAGAKS